MDDTTKTDASRPEVPTVSAPSRAQLLEEAERAWLKHATRLGRSNVYDPREVEAVAAMLAGLGAVRGGRPPRRKVTPERG